MERTASQVATSALVTGTVASLVSTAALAALSRGEDKSAVQPTNATSHWLHGDGAARHRGIDSTHTAVGYATHHASAVFWALPYEAWLSREQNPAPGTLLCKAAVVSAIAAAVDYGLTPRRLTPGWEHILSKSSMLGAFASFAIGLAAGAVVRQQCESILKR